MVGLDPGTGGARMARSRCRGEGGAGPLLRRSGLRVARRLGVELLRVQLLRARLLGVRLLRVRARLGTVLRMDRLHGELCGCRLSAG